jgi:penicillin-binding protein 1A
VEDRRFYRHPGIDPIGLARAVVRDLQQGSRAEGASTLTQQLARTLFLSNVKSYGRKLREAGIALLIEAQLTKPQILEFYLNRVYLSAGVYGVQTMSEHLFRKPASAVTLPEAALIAGLIRAPSALSPWSNYDGALERSHLVLAAMRDQGFITAARKRSSARGAAAHPAVPSAERRTSRLGEGLSPSTVPRRVRRRQPAGLAGAHGVSAQGAGRGRARGRDGARPDAAPRTRGGTRGDRSADRRHSRDGRRRQLSAQHVQSRDAQQAAARFGVQASRLHRGTRARLLAVSLLSNLQHVTAPDNPEWMPGNAHGEQPDAMTLRAALLESNNAAAADLQQLVGSKAVLRLASDAGLEGLPDVRRWRSAPGSSPRWNSPPSTRCFPAPARSPSRAGSSACSMRAARRSWTGPFNAPRSSLRRSHSRWSACCATSSSGGPAPPARAFGVRGAVGGKTGTTDDYHDAWFVGFSTSVVAGVWVGFDQPAPIAREAYGARVALPIWADFMKRVAQTLPPGDFQAPPASTSKSSVACRTCGRRRVPDLCRILQGRRQVPSQLCTVHRGSLKERTAHAVGGFFRSLGVRSPESSAASRL